ncbi:glycosyltransferase family 1 protein [Trichoderma harzianum CBS 226.95]|uniref:Glycosyltransferase family 1 protein n=1 Tax=Trichoderma harzianum CBS 226.95 TaxID=983964 RepID=A0A2T4AEJ3_TRIHA|nr:glycosyltransferase family 1 protein [Trichoderma harzianum CBS 226.95]PTB55442.1 glycosyltransferase family 1 protein [Trichoderma harzianum CBS 226.95]
MVSPEIERSKGRRQPSSRPPPASEAMVTDGFVLPTLDVPPDAPPAYGSHHDQLQFSRTGFEAGAEVTGDGRINISINTKNKRLAELLAPSIASQVDAQPSLPPVYTLPSLTGEPGKEAPPRLNVVIQIVGSRGDVQPFVALGKVLKETYGHRIRIATHATFKTFVEENGLEFFSIGGDPAELMAFMVKHPGLMPGLDALKSGEISKRRRGVQEMMLGCWRSCIEAGDGLGPPPEPHRRTEPWDPSAGMPGDPNHEPFVADAIIANPPSFAHIHVAEKLGIPLHMMFTMPWSPTRAFPHPLANVQSSNADDVLTNYLTYTLVEMMTWQGLGDVINRFRENALDLPPLSLIWAPGLLNRLKISYTYCWSPALIPKPNDWGPHIDVAGFYFLNLASSYTPEPDLAAFLEAGPPPVYIGFGSIVVDDPNAMTRLILDAIHLAGVRALVSKGWGGLGVDAVGLPDGVFMLGNVPHDWLFERVSCVVHHGGAGTTAAGIKAGKPTIVVPFFGDQPFWGAMIARAKAGPDPIPHKTLTAEKLAEAIKFCLRQETQDQAQALGRKIREENGAETGSRSFHNHIDIDSLRCSVAPSRAAAWRLKKTKVRLSPLVAAVLVERRLLKYSDLKLYRPYEYNTEDQPPDPITAGATSLVTDISDIGMAIVDMPLDIFKSPRKARERCDAASQASGDESDPESRSNSIKGRSGRITPTTASIADTAGDPNSAALLVQSPSLPTEVSRTRSPTAGSPGGSRSSSRRRALSAAATMEAAVGTSKNVGRIVTTGVKSPMNFCLGLAKGFRNIPRLYNDDTVRAVEKVTDFNSGVRVAGKELGFGLYDGISGLVTQPMRGAQKQGAAGLIKGVGKGIGGLIAKPAAGFWGLPAYVMQGAYAELNKFLSRSVQNYIITSRVVQGERDMQNASEGEKADILYRWKQDADLRTLYQKSTNSQEPENSRAGSRSESSSWRFSPQEGRRQLVAALSQSPSRQNSGRRNRRSSSPAPRNTDATAAVDTEYEAAIRASVLETSRGDAEEDATIEAAIRESVKAMRQQGSLPDPIRLAMDSKHHDIFADEEYKITDEEYQDLIEQAIRESMTGHVGDFSMPSASGTQELDAVDTAIPTHGGEPRSSGSALTPTSDEDADLQRAIEESRKAAPTLPPRTSPSQEQEEDEDEHLRRAIEASKDEMERARHERTEEEIVMEYVKKQSLAEEEFRKQQLAKGKGKEVSETTNDGEGDGDDDEELRRAIEESLKMSGGSRSAPSGS